MEEMAATMEQFAGSKGYNYLVNLEELPTAEEGIGEGLEKDAVGALNRNMQEIRGSMEFMQKLLDEMRYEPVVEETLIGVE